MAETELGVSSQNSLCPDAHVGAEFERVWVGDRRLELRTSRV